MKTKQDLDFKPTIVGINLKAQKEALSTWENLVEVSNETLIQIINFLDREDCSTKDFFELTSLNPKETMIRLYKISGNAPEGMSIEKLIDLDLINNVHAKDVKNNLFLFKNAKSEAMKLFNYDLANLRDKEGLFGLNDNFNKAIQEHFTVYTNSLKQNEALKYLNQIIEGLNYFARSGLIKAAIGTLGLDPLMIGIQATRDSKGFIPKLNLFKLLKWKAIFN
ncbi:MAG: hypothetical protein HN778_17185 [Prolixibacteraceae bacterium]|jgi:hypothetical protein|nr:hypothetical protein [Prolixibacteraceae bacterium]MBT6005120.1 hypothetical protein [Prolixibacteraceae bacterium]MBT6764325.1 hypothetical protein [Prolixibacteraceae bacterium]MBT6999869.1 hypothetical protein [Prolixibacteraceae bacterium]MBT7396564.1 hypothetical protein [Prolixibacteraceae bacterium]